MGITQCAVLSYLSFMFNVRFEREEKKKDYSNVRVTSVFHELEVSQRLNPQLHRNTKNKT